jgi:hypothetical protein
LHSAVTEATVAPNVADGKQQKARLGSAWRRCLSGRLLYTVAGHGFAARASEGEFVSNAEWRTAGRVVQVRPRPNPTQQSPTRRNRSPRWYAHTTTLRRPPAPDARIQLATHATIGLDSRATPQECRSQVAVQKN